MGADAENETKGAIAEPDKKESSDSKSEAARWAVTLGAVVTTLLAIFGAGTGWYHMQAEFHKDELKIASDQKEAEASRTLTADLNKQQADLAVKLKKMEGDQKSQELAQAQTKAEDAAVGELLAHILSGKDAAPFLGQLAFYSNNPRYSGPLLDALGSRVLHPNSESEVRLAFLALDRSGTVALDTVIEADRAATAGLVRAGVGMFLDQLRGQSAGVGQLRAFQQKAFRFVDSLTDDYRAKLFLLTAIINEVRFGHFEPTNNVVYEARRVIDKIFDDDVPDQNRMRRQEFEKKLAAFRDDRQQQSAGADISSLQAKVVVMSESVKYLQQILPNASMNSVDLSSCYLLGLDWNTIPSRRKHGVNVSSAYLSKMVEDLLRQPQGISGLGGIKNAVFVPGMLTALGDARQDIDKLLTLRFQEAPSYYQ